MGEGAAFMCLVLAVACGLFIVLAAVWDHWLCYHNKQTSEGRDRASSLQQANRGGETPQSRWRDKLLYPTVVSILSTVIAAGVLYLLGIK